MATHISVYASPERYVQGADATEYLGEQMKLLGLKGPVLIVGSHHATLLLSETWKRSLGNAGYEEQYYKTFGGECSEREVQEIVELIKQHGCKTVVGSGGGKVIDAVRAAAGRLEHVDVVSAPTVASTDAPCSALAVIYNENGEVETYEFQKRHPSLVLVDTSVIAKAPVRMLVGGLGDALATWFEARTVREARQNNFLGGKPTLTGTALAELCYRTLIEDGVQAKAAVEVQAVTPALERVVEANTLLSGLGFECGGICTAHAVHNALTACSCTLSKTHGEKVSFGLCTQLHMEGRPAEEINTVLKWQDAVGLPVTLQEVNIDSSDEDSIRIIAERTVQKGETVHNSPFEVTATMVAHSMIAADYLGTRYKDRQELL